MSHNVGTVQTASPPFSIGPDTGAPPSGPDTLVRGLSVGSGTDPNKMKIRGQAIL